MSPKFEDIFRVTGGYGSVATYAHEHGNNFFSGDNTRFYDSTYSNAVYRDIRNDDRILFVTGEKFTYGSPRLYTVRAIYRDGSIADISRFQQFKSLSGAKGYAMREAGVWDYAKEKRNIVRRELRKFANFLGNMADGMEGG